jgi:hypothetical protein
VAELEKLDRLDFVAEKELLLRELLVTDTEILLLLNVQLTESEDDDFV